MKLLICAIFILASALAASAQNAITTGALNLLSTFENISVRAEFTGDANENATATVEFKPSSSGTWLPAYTPFIDYRATKLLGGANPGEDEARVSIVGLQPDTSYDVRITWSDADGVTGTNPVSGAISTLDLTPPLGGSDIWVDAAAGGGGNGTPGSPFNTIAAALAVVAPGDTIRIVAGSYSPFSVSVDGEAGAWIKIQGESQAGVVISGGATDNVELSSDYIIIDNMTFSQSAHNSIDLNGSHHIFIQNTIHTNIASNSSGTYAGVSLNGAYNNVYILNNEFHTTNDANAFIYGVYTGGTPGGTVVIADNVFDGADFRDQIGGGVGPGENSDFARNTHSGPEDEAIEVEGDNINNRAYGNTITCPCTDAFGIAPSEVGPYYIFRNLIIGGGSENFYSLKQGNGAGGPVYIFHNTFDLPNSGTRVADDAGGTPYSEYHYYFNNIYSHNRYSYQRGGRTNVYDYNLHYDQGTGDPLISDHNPPTNDNYNDLAAFQSGESQELNGLEGDPLFLNAAREIDADSPAYNAGVSLANFNDANSAWPAQNGAPDMGYFEVGGAGGGLTFLSPPSSPSLAGSAPSFLGNPTSPSLSGSAVAALGNPTSPSLSGAAPSFLGNPTSPGLN